MADDIEAEEEAEEKEVAREDREEGIDLFWVAVIAIAIIGAFCIYEVRCIDGHCAEKFGEILKIIRG